MIRKNSRSIIHKKPEDNPTIVGRKVDNMVNLKKQREVTLNHGKLMRQVPGVHRVDCDEEKLQKSAS